MRVVQSTLFRPGPVIDLAIVRIVWVAFQLFWLLVGAGRERLLQANSLDGYGFDPLPILQLLALPLGGAARLDAESMLAVHAATMLAGTLALIGLATRTSLAVLAWGSAMIAAWVYSHGTFHHDEALMIVALAALALAPSGHALSIDARLRKGQNESEFARWPLLLTRGLVALAYLSAAAAKIGRCGGLGWTEGGTLQYWSYVKARELGAPFGVWVSEHPGVAQALSCAVLAFEITFVVTLFLPRVRWAYIALGTMIHIMTQLTLGVQFYQFVLLYLAFTPWRKGRGISSK